MTCRRRWLGYVHYRLATHCTDVAAVVSHLRISGGLHLIGLCAGAAYAEAFAAAHPGLVDKSHVTLVAPWVSGDCAHNSWLVRHAGVGHFGPHAGIGPLLALIQMPRLRRVTRAPSELHALHAATAAFSASERDRLTRRCRLDDTMAARLVSTLKCDLASHSLGGFSGDVAVCLAPSSVLTARAGGGRRRCFGTDAVRLHDSGPRGNTSLATEVTVLAGTQDELVPWEATVFLCQRLHDAGAKVRLVSCAGGSHTGVHYMRAEAWLQAAATRGRSVDSMCHVDDVSPGIEGYRLPRLDAAPQAEAAAAAAAQALLPISGTTSRSRGCDEPTSINARVPGL